jgi:hypothetical protein
MNEPAVSLTDSTAREYLPAHYYLRIYRLKLAMAEDGATQPNPAWEGFMRRLVAALKELDPETPIQLDSTNGLARFINVRNGFLLGEFDLSEAS